MGLAQISAEQKQQLTHDVGTVLIERHGKRKHYSQREVKSAVDFLGVPKDWSCWAYSFFMSAPDFATYHASIGEVCDYAAMRTGMVEAIAVDTSWFDADLSWLEFPADILSNVFDIW